MARSTRRFNPDGISPPAWGWPGDHRVIQSRRDFPTRVGMARDRLSRISSIDFPTRVGMARDHGGCSGSFPISPPAWGWPARTSLRIQSRRDFPTRVGMARDSSSRQSIADDFPTRVGMARSPDIAGFPHPRGDGPRLECADRFPHPRGDGPTQESLIMPEISPPAWGWPVTLCLAMQSRRDFPTRVGMARGRLLSVSRG